VDSFHENHLLRGQKVAPTLSRCPTHPQRIEVHTAADSAAIIIPAIPRDGVISQLLNRIHEPPNLLSEKIADLQGNVGWRLITDH